MAIAGVDVASTIPLGTFIIVNNARSGVTPWISWADTHNHYSTVNQIAGFI
jgi:pheromone a factor receptor